MLVNVDPVLFTRSWLRLYFSIEYTFAVLLNFFDCHFEIGYYDYAELGKHFHGSSINKVLRSLVQISS